MPSYKSVCRLSMFIMIYHTSTYSKILDNAAIVLQGAIKLNYVCRLMLLNRKLAP